MWCVDERTVKREMAKLRAKGWLFVTRQGAKGRVTQYGLCISALLEDTKQQWNAVGPVCALRMSGSPLAADKVVPLPLKGNVPAPEVADGSEWALAQVLLHREDPA